MAGTASNRNPYANAKWRCSWKTHQCVFAVSEFKLADFECSAKTFYARATCASQLVCNHCGGSLARVQATHYLFARKLEGAFTRQGRLHASGLVMF